MKLSQRLLLFGLPPVAAIMIRLIHLSVRTEILGVAQLNQVWERGERAIISFWHDQLLLMVFGYPARGAKLLISASTDGELVARTMASFGHGTVRGSSSRGGRGAFRELVSLSREDCDLVLTPDGPRGPRHQLKDGVVQLARMSGRPVLPLAFVCSRGRRFGSWDRFLLPYPGSRGVFSYGPPLYYDRSLGNESFKVELNKAMQQNQQRAELKLESYGCRAV